MNRRHFIGLMGTAAAGGLYARSRRPKNRRIEGGIVGASNDLGHLLRDGKLPTARESRKRSVLIVGGGIAGLSAGWRLLKAGFTDFEILELEAEIGGNSRGGANAISPYPWGAHYLPVPTRESRAVRELLAELSVLQGDPQAERPIYDERYVCFAPHERLYRHGQWQEGLQPEIGITRQDREHYRRFHELIEGYKNRRDSSGRKAFAVPMEYSARDADLLALDTISMHEFLIQKKLDSEPLHWYVNYACRDDYGCDYREVSAWMGLHYFAARDGKAQDIEDDAVLTWPEGNAWIVQRLRERLQAHIRTQSLVLRLQDDERALRIRVYHPKENRCTDITAEQVVWAAPSFLLPYVLAGLDTNIATALREFQYAPWLVANLSLNEFPYQRLGTAMAWDNVIYNSPALGYVTATHQQLASRPLQTVLTWYRPLSDMPPLAARKHLLETPWSAWVEQILQDLSRPHPEIRELVSRIDLMRWGHAMVRPRPGFVWGDARRRLTEFAQQPKSRLHLAHSDLSGYSVFEEANYRGVSAAEAVLARLGIASASIL
jgi:hypothetical protein